MIDIVERVLRPNVVHRQCNPSTLKRNAGLSIVSSLSTFSITSFQIHLDILITQSRTETRIQEEEEKYLVNTLACTQTYIQTDRRTDTDKLTDDLFLIS